MYCSKRPKISKLLLENVSLIYNFLCYSGSLVARRGITAILRLILTLWLELWLFKVTHLEVFSSIFFQTFPNPKTTLFGSRQIQLCNRNFAKFDVMKFGKLSLDGFVIFSVSTFSKKRTEYGNGVFYEMRTDTFLKTHLFKLLVTCYFQQQP